MEATIPTSQLNPVPPTVTVIWRTFKFCIYKDVQMLPWVGIEVPGDGMQTYGGVVQ